MCKKSIRSILMLPILVLVVLFIPLTASAEPYNGKVFELKQPDGSVVTVKVFGDEFYQRVESLDGYTLVRDSKTNYICYAKFNGDSSDFISTDIVYNGIQSDKLSKNIAKGLKLDKKYVVKKVKENQDKLKWDAFLKGASPVPNTQASASTVTANALEGDVLGLTILIDFPDVKSGITKAQIESMLNAVGYNGYSNDGSVRDYFYDVSGGKLVYTNTVTAFYTAKNNKAYYEDPNIPYATRAQELLVEALQYLNNNNLVDFSTLSTDSSGFVRALNVLYAGAPDSGWAKGLWPHSSGISPFYADGVYLSRYQMTNIGTDLSIGTFAHENGHMLCGWPDTYDYGYESAGLGYFDLMSGGNYGGGGKNPTPPNPYFRCTLSGWGTPTRLNNYANDSTIWVNANSVTPYIFENSSNPNEFFMFENIKKAGRWTAMPDDGFAIWHIDRNGSNNNQEMTPTSHYMVSLEQADGNFDLERNNGWGDANDLFYAGYRDRFDSTTVPNCNWWNGQVSNLRIKGISALGDTMTFTLGVPVPANKQWTITFNTPILSSSVTNQSIYVLDINNNPFPVTLSVGSDLKTVFVSPNGNYVPGAWYTLYVTPNVKSAGGKNLVLSKQRTFVIQ